MSQGLCMRQERGPGPSLRPLRTMEVAQAEGQEPQPHLTHNLHQPLPTLRNPLCTPVGSDPPVLT